MKRNEFLSALPLALFACACSAASSESDDAEVANSKGALYYEANKVWADPSISVCWKSSTNATERGWVQSAVEAAFEPLSDVDFTGWGICGTGGAEVVISVGNSYWPKATLGSRSASTLPNMWLNPFVGAAQDLDGDGDVTEFEPCYSNTPGSGSAYTGITGQYWASYRQRCIEVIAVHEFFHILAVAHEQNRSDTPASCTAAADGWGDTNYGYWDWTSISNYCNPAWNGDGLLSPLDVSGLVTLYGRDTNDHVWFGIGNIRDYSLKQADQTMFEVTAQSVVNAYVPQIADFNGDGRADLLWYRAGTGSDPIWWGRSDRDFDHGTASSIDSTYQMTTGDFDGDKRGDIFMHAPGNVYDRVWYGRSDKTFDDIRTANIAGTFKPIAGDFDDDGFSDIFLYAAGSTMDVIWWGRGDRTFTRANAQENVTGTYTPLAGDFDGDGNTDIFWYYPGGSQNEFVWYGRADRTFDTTADIPNRAGTYQPTVGDFDGSGTSDILWGRNTSETESLFLFSRTRGVYTDTSVSSVLGSSPFAGDFDGDGISDVFWYLPD